MNGRPRSTTVEPFERTGDARSPVEGGTHADRPVLRGTMHQAAAVVGLVAGIVLVAAAPQARSRALCAVYAVSLVAMFTASALFHRWPWRTETARARARTFDHIAAFVVIAGTYTPIAGLGLDGAARVLILVAVWGGVVIGAVLELTWAEPPRAVLTAMYVVVGSIIAVDIDGLAARVGVTDVTLVTVGGILYVLGAVVYACRRPDPSPTWFGFHEVFHTLVVAAAVVHFVAVARIARSV
jgi:hemolysin III